MMFKIYSPQVAQQTILKRQSPDENIVPDAILERIEKLFGERISPETAVSRILHEVRSLGDIALKKWTEKLDLTHLNSFNVPEEDIENAISDLPKEQIAALEESVRRVEAFHRHQPLISWMTNDLGGTLGQYIRPIRRVGLYVPGGTAPLPSSVIMSAIPAKVAGVQDVVVVTPPNPEYYHQTGKHVPEIILAACALSGVKEVYTVGGAQAIGAMAFGTESIRSVDKIFGPGNLFVTLAKRQVFGTVGIDGLFGPTETMVIADDSAKPAWVAADLLAQAEHDVLASAILLTPSQALAESVQKEISFQTESLPRKNIIGISLENRSGAVIVNNLEEAIDLSNNYGPEHLCLAVSDPWSLVNKIYNAGGIFLGEHSFEVLGDYIAGPSHVMPTGGTARFSSPLNVWDFVHIINLIALDTQTGSRISAHAAQFARAESLEAHARSADKRL
ncbi:MAG: histidinol dehydrogenase [Chloroflexota bacterium]